MIQMQTILQCADNSGASLLRCIKVIGGSGRKYAFAGDVVVVSVIGINNKKTRGSSKIKKGDMSRAVVVRTKKTSLRVDGSYVKFDSNAVVLISNQGEPVGSRVFGPIDREVRSNYIKISSMSLEVV